MEVERISARPTTATEWLMTPYKDTPNLDEEHRDVVAHAVDNLTPRLRDALEGFFFERLSYAQIGQRLGVSKTHAWRLVRQATSILKTQLEHNPTIQRRYKMATWQDAAYVALCGIDENPHATANILDLEDLDSISIVMGNDIRRGLEPLSCEIESIADIIIPWLRYMELWDRDSLLELLARKQADYGHDNIERLGRIGIAVRMCDKIARLLNLSKKDGVTAVKDETLLDTLHDLVGYVVIASMLERGTFFYNLKGAA